MHTRVLNPYGISFLILFSFHLSAVKTSWRNIFRNCSWSKHAEIIKKMDSVDFSLDCRLAIDRLLVGCILSDVYKEGTIVVTLMIHHVFSFIMRTWYVKYLLHLCILLLSSWLWTISRKWRDFFGLLFAYFVSWMWKLWINKLDLDIVKRSFYCNNLFKDSALVEDWDKC